MTDITGLKTSPPKLPTMKELKPLLEPYCRPRVKRAIWQLVSTLIPYTLLWVLMWFSLSISYALTLLLSVLAAAFMIRIFIFFHDCGHNSFLPSTRANKIVGFWLGLLVFTPGELWWHSHAIHHSTSGNLDRRGIGDVVTMTVKEYLAAPLWKRIGYRIFRHPLGFLGAGPVVVFLLRNRLPIPHFGRKEMLSVVYANLGIVAIAAAISLLIGFKAYVMIQLPILWIGGAIGIWMFYIQHQYVDAYWAPAAEWDYVKSALLGASCYKLPALLRWFSGNIGFHHIHHLNPRIPNYELFRCYIENLVFQTYAKIIPFGKGYPSLVLSLWDEDQNRMVSFKDTSRRRRG